MREREKEGFIDLEREREIFRRWKVLRGREGSWVWWSEVGDEMKRKDEKKTESEMSRIFFGILSFVSNISIKFFFLL